MNHHLRRHVAIAVLWTGTLALGCGIVSLAGCSFFSPPDNRPGYRPWQGNGPDVPGSYTNALPAYTNAAAGWAR